MLRFGYDFFDSKTNTILRPNGTRYNKKIIGEICQLYLPPWWRHLLERINEDYEINSVKKFSQNQYNEKWIYILEPLGDPRGWFGLYDDGQENKVKSFLHGISPTALKQIKDNKAIIVVWYAQEGPLNYHLNVNILEEFHKELQRLNINPHNFVYVVGNLRTKEDYKKLLSTKKIIYEGGKEKEITYENIENINIIEFQSQTKLEWSKKWNLAEFKPNKKIEKKFLCFNRELSHPHRLFLLTLLQENKLLDYGLVSFNKITKILTKIFFNNLRDWFGFGNKLIEQKLKYLEQIKPLSPSVIDVDEWETNHYDTSPSWPYDKTLFSLVSETHFAQKTLYLSEKIWKAMANNHIFILAAPYQTLHNIRERGYKTFSPYIDESYDNEKNPYERLKKIMIEVKKLCSLSEEECKELILKTEEIVRYNRERLLNYDDDTISAFNELKELIK